MALPTKADLVAALERTLNYLDDVINETLVANCPCGNPFHRGHDKDCELVELRTGLDQLRAEVAELREEEWFMVIRRDGIPGELLRKRPAANFMAVYGKELRVVPAHVWVEGKRDDARQAS